jgi:hypothetical protein
MRDELNHSHLGPGQEQSSEHPHSHGNRWDFISLLVAGLAVGWYFTLPGWFRGLVSMVLVPVLLIGFAVIGGVVLLRRSSRYDSGPPPYRPDHSALEPVRPRWTGWRMPKTPASSNGNGNASSNGYRGDRSEH